MNNNNVYVREGVERREKCLKFQGLQSPFMKIQEMVKQMGADKILITPYFNLM